MARRSWTPLAAALLFTAIAAIIGRDVLAQLGTGVANDAGDPLLTAAILKWNATHVPLTDAWWQFPSFYPTRDVLAFSEHLLGLSVIASPIYWISGDALVTYNLTTLLTFVLSALAMYALVWRLTASMPAAIVAGLAFGFAPYRVSQLPHIQMLAAFWAPLALLGLHAFLETGKRRWLVLYAATWALQAAANGYALFFFSILVGLWVLWFVVAARRWQALAMIATATVLAALPLAPILYKYVTVHALHGFERSIDEIRFFSGDIAAVLCAPERLTFWGWIRVMCRPEGELFPGVALFALALVALARLVGWLGAPAAPPSRQPLRLLRSLLIAIAVLYAVIVASVLIVGPWRIDWGVLRMSTTTLQKPLMVLMLALLGVLALSPGVRAALSRSSRLGFYLVAAVVTWLLALGPTLTFMGVPTGVDGPFSWLMVVPGMDGLRVPARFWLMTNLCLSVVAGLLIADVLARRSRLVTAIATAVVGAAVLADGWSGAIGVQPAPPQPPDVRALQGGVVLELPIGDYNDIAPQWRAVNGGWTSINGYSGWGPSYYPAITQAARFEEDALFLPFQRDTELSVLIARDAVRLIALVERQPGARRVASNEAMVQYRLPRRQRDAPAVGRRIAIAGLQTLCDPATVGLARDGDVASRWVCTPPGDRQELTIDLGHSQTVSGFVQTMGRFGWEAPRYLEVETSPDGRAWEPAWNGSVLEQTILGGIGDPSSLRIVVPFAPRPARYLRVRPQQQEPGFHWTIAEVEVLGARDPG